MVKYFKTRATLIKDYLGLENKIIERERKKWFDEKLTLMSEYESKIITAANDAADDREREIRKLVTKKENELRELQGYIHELKAGYRRFKDDVQENEIMSQELNIDIQATMNIMRQLAGRFEALEYKITRVSERVDKKDIRMIKEGKS